MILNIIKNKLGISQKPSCVSFFVTYRCNCRCVMCDVWKKDYEFAELSLIEIDKIFKDLGKLDVVRLSGGETFLKEDIGKIINIIDKRSNPKIIHIATNGVLTKRIIAVLKEVDNPHKIHIKVSIDGVGEKHDSIRGVKGVYDKAIITLNKLSKLSKKLGFYLAVSQTIVDEDGIKSYYILRDLLKKNGIKIHAALAYNFKVLYGNGKKLSTIDSSELVGTFSKEVLSSFFETLEQDAGKISNLPEKMLKKYYVLGLKNRLLKGVCSPNPKCVALNNHLRILPNGDVPVCIYNPIIVGNLKRQSIHEVWFGNEIKKEREWVNNCTGCWAGCEIHINTVYTGDILRVMFK